MPTHVDTTLTILLEDDDARPIAATTISYENYDDALNAFADLAYIANKRNIPRPPTRRVPAKIARAHQPEDPDRPA